MPLAWTLTADTLPAWQVFYSAFRRNASGLVKGHRKLNLPAPTCKSPREDCSRLIVAGGTNAALSVLFHVQYHSAPPDDHCHNPTQGVHWQLRQYACSIYTSPQHPRMCAAIKDVDKNTRVCRADRGIGVAEVHLQAYAAAQPVTGSHVVWEQARTAQPLQSIWCCVLVLTPGSARATRSRQNLNSGLCRSLFASLHCSFHSHMMVS